MNMKEKSGVFTAVHLKGGGEVKPCIFHLVRFPTYPVNSVPGLEAIGEIGFSSESYGHCAKVKSHASSWRVSVCASAS